MYYANDCSQVCTYTALQAEIRLGIMSEQKFHKISVAFRASMLQLLQKSKQSDTKALEAKESDQHNPLVT
jgi:hypothetical protein